MFCEELQSTTSADVLEK